MSLTLKNPLIFFDLETTGINISKDRIVEISIYKINPDGTKDEPKTRRLNPEMPIPPESSAVHGIYDADVVDCPTFKSVAKSLANYIEGCDIAGFNSNRFDVPLLAEEFLRVGVDVDLKRRKMIDVQNIFHAMEQRTLVAAYKFYCGKDLTKAHSAEADTIATYEVLMSQIEKYEELEGNVDFLSEFSTRSKSVDFAGMVVLNEDDVPVFNFGKHKGKSVLETFKRDPSYYSWIMNGDFPAYTKKVMTELRLK